MAPAAAAPVATPAAEAATRPSPWTGRGAAWGGGLGFALLLAVGLCHHEMWRDELQAWMLARVSPTPAALLAAMRYEGHPALWHLLLWPLAQATPRPEAMQALHFAVAVLGAATFLAWAPLPLQLRALFVVGYLPLFEYGVVSRNYALALPLLWGVCRLSRGEPGTREPRRWLALGGCLALLANANPYAWMLAAAMLAAFAFETLGGREGRRALAANPRAVIVSAALAVAGLVVALWQMVPPPDALYAASVTTWSPARLYRVVGTVVSGTLPLPDWRTGTPWNSALVYRLPPPLLAGLGLAWLAVAWLLLGSRAARALFALGTAALLAFGYLHYIGWARHHGHFFLLFVAGCWLAADRRDGEGDTGPRRRLRLAVLGVLLAVHAAAAAWLYTADLRRPFSDAEAAAARLTAPPLAGLPAVGYPDPPLPALAAYRGETLLSLTSGRPLAFVRWRRGDERKLGGVELCALLTERTRDNSGTIAFVAPPAAMPAACPGLVVERIGRSTKPLVPSERLATWRVALGGAGAAGGNG